MPIFLQKLMSYGRDKEKSEMNDKNEYCNCTKHSSVTAGFEDDFGYWLVCTDCGKKIRDNYHYYNHYDGEDHEMFLGPNGDIVD